MSSQNINISRENIQGKCDLKCSYNFKYTESNLTAKNTGVLIQLTYDDSNIPPVVYNNNKYNVSKICIVSPSIHTFNKTTFAAEIFIEHSPVSGGKLLSVAIPIKLSSELSDASNLINEIIQNVATNAPVQGETTNLNISGFTLQKIIPNKPFFSYSTKNEDWIVFGEFDAISLSSKTLTILSQIIKPFPIPTQGNELFFNASGPNAGAGIGDGIYISCKPTGSSEEETAVEFTKNTSSYDVSHLFDNPVTKIIFQIIFGCLIFIIIFIVMNYFYTWVTIGSVKPLFTKKS
jgi:carbonic anhydrase